MAEKHCRHRALGWLTSATGIVALAGMLSGCSSKSEVPVGDAAENIRKLALAYVEYASAHNGVGPADQKALAKHLAQSDALSVDEANSRFVSPRDDKPYVIRWKQRPMAASAGPDPPKPALLIYEQDGADGTRYVADGRMSVKEMSDDQISQTYPEYDNASG